MYQRLIIIGNLGRDPEMRYTVDGKPVTSFTVATSRKMKGEKETTWFHVSVWGNQAETCNQHLHKGSKVLVEGRLKAEPSVYDKKDGSGWASNYEITADNVRFLSGKSDDAPVVDYDEIPF
jgi:single-strand DNA-binding protein